MRRKIAAIVLFLVGLVATPSVYAECIVNTATPTYINGKRIDLQCDQNGNVKTTATLSGGGDASAANQTTQITHLSAIKTAVEGQLNTELPAAAALADDTANPTVPGVASFNMCFDGSTWDRCVKGTGGSGAVDSATARTTEATDSQLSTDIAAIKTAVQLIDDDQTGASLKHFVTAGVTEDETEVKASAGRLISVQASNSAATVAYLRCANQVAASTTPGTTTVFWGMAVPGATTGAGVVANFGPMGIAFSTGLTCWVVGGKAETDVAEVGANDVQVNIQYK